MRVALKIAYDGRPFHGFARQPDVRTVEGEVIYALTKAELIRNPEAARFRGASRTDAGVSALGNVIAFDGEAADAATVGRFNDAANEVWAWAVAELPPGFDPRKANARWYRYLLAGDHDAAKLREAAQAFVGAHDFAAFASPDAERTRRRVDSLEVTPAEDGILIDVRAPSFLRGMVRRIVSALLAVESGDASPDDLRTALSTGSGDDLGLASAEPLVLMDVDLGFPFRPAANRATRERITTRLKDERAAARFWREAAARVATDFGAPLS
jgi:tRNA pseudouridine38-40 synthase